MITVKVPNIGDDVAVKTKNEILCFGKINNNVGLLEIDGSVVDRSFEVVDVHGQFLYVPHAVSATSTSTSTTINASLSLDSAFAQEMVGRIYGEEETADAKFWFSRGWNVRGNQ